MLWDIFCRVIDNFGDIGVCWRLSVDLAARGQTVRLWVDDGQALQWMAPGALECKWPGVEVLPWERSCHDSALQTLARADIWIEAFGCDIPAPFVAHFATQEKQPGADALRLAHKSPVWINLEYLSAEAYVERSHGLPSPVMHGPARGWTKFFFYPGFSAGTGGLLRGPDSEAPPRHTAPTEFLSELGLEWQGERLVSLFCYEPPLLDAVLNQLAAAPEPTRLLVTAGRACAAVQGLWGTKCRSDSLQISYLPLLTQAMYDRLLANCEINFVRGEDSVVRALWAGKPFVWHIYPQEDQAHGPKLEAFMERLQLCAPIRALHRAWNGLTGPSLPALGPLPLNPAALLEWQMEVQTARAKLRELPDLTTNLLRFVQENR